MLMQSRRVTGDRNRLTQRVSLRRWLRRHAVLVRRSAWAVILLAGISVGIQLAYPAGRTLPFVSAGQIDVGGNNRAGVIRTLDSSLATATITFRSGAKHIQTPLHEAGVRIDKPATAQAAASYPVAQRLIPFSAVVIMLTRDAPLVPQFDTDHVGQYARRIEKEGFAEAVNATVRVRDGDASIVPAKSQRSYPAERVKRALHTARFSTETQLAVTPQTKPAQRTGRQVAPVLQAADRALSTKLTVQVHNEQASISRATLGSWLTFPEDSATKALRVAVDPDAINSYFAAKYPALYKAPGTTKVQVIDGKEVGRSVGNPGEGLDAPKAVALFEQALTKGGPVTIRLPLATLPAKVVYERTYSNSDAGLKAVVDAAAGSHGVAVMEIGGRSAAANGTKQFVSASTYKLYIAYAVAKAVEAGRMAWEDPFNGQTVASCFDKMIVVSNNGCPKAFGSMFGWQAVEDMMHSIGLSSATQMSPANYTTASDLALFLYKLQNGSLLSPDSTARLLDAMKRQNYTRAGIPAGAKGSVVADKVGDVDGYKHDAAIVFGPKGPYVLVVMTNGGSWDGIAAVTNKIHAYLSK